MAHCGENALEKIFHGENNNDDNNFYQTSSFHYTSWMININISLKRQLAFDDWLTVINNMKYEEKEKMK